MKNRARKKQINKQFAAARHLPSVVVAELPEFDYEQYLDSDEAVMVYLADILSANDPALLELALSKIGWKVRGAGQMPCLRDRQRLKTIIDYN